MTISIKSKKAKARKLQNFIRDSILKRFPELELDDCRPAIMGEPNEDIKFSPAARKLLNISVECKAVERIKLYQSWKQTVENTPDGANSVLTIKRSHSPVLAVIEWDYLLQLIRESK